MRIPDVTYPMGEPEIYTPRTPEIVTPHDPETGPKESPHSVPDRTAPDALIEKTCLSSKDRHVRRSLPCGILGRFSFFDLDIYVIKRLFLFNRDDGNWVGNHLCHKSVFRRG